MKKLAIILALMLAVMASCSTSPDGRQETPSATRGLADASWREVIDGDLDKVKDLFFAAIQEDDMIQPLLEARDFDVNRKDLVDLKGMPVYRLDSAQFYALTPQSDFESVLTLDTKNADFLVLHKGDMAFLIKASYNDGWRDIVEIGAGAQKVLQDNLVKAFNAGEEAIVVEIYKRKKGAFYSKAVYVKKDGRWISANTGKEAVEDLISIRNRPAGLSRD